MRLGPSVGSSMGVCLAAIADCKKQLLFRRMGNFMSKRQPLLFSRDRVLVAIALIAFAGLVIALVHNVGEPCFFPEYLRWTL